MTAKLFIGGWLLALVAAGCVTKSQANAQARAAYLAGQQAALASVAVQGQGVTIIGPVQHPNVPWVVGLTLSQAIATAEYTGQDNPEEITINRRGVTIDVDPDDLLNGHVVTLEPGDTITIRE